MFQFAQWLQATPLSVQLQNMPLLVPIAQSIHIVAIGLLFMSVVMVVLRVLGWTGRGVSVMETERRFALWMWGALVVLVLTGLSLVISEPIRTLVTTSFWVKMGLLAVGIAAALTFQAGLRRHAGFWEDEAASRIGIRILGVATVLVWVGVIAFGRFIAYDQQILGPLSIYPY